MKPPAVESPLLSPLSDAEVYALGCGELIVREDAFGRDAVAEARSTLEAWHADGRLTPAGVGRNGEDRGIRGDRTAWLSGADPELASLFARFEVLRQLLAYSLRRALPRFAVQAARYDAGAGYAPHVDAFRGDPSRVVTAIWYLNPGWNPADGGQLRADVSGGPVDVEPIADRLVVFLSEEVRHAVLASHAPRYALTAWYRGPEPIPFLPDP